DSRSFYYTVEHCNADWTPSRIPVMDYMSGYEEDRIYTIQSSENTKIPYSHYSFDFPNDNMRLKLAGNYILQVYEDADKSRLLFSRKLFVMNNMATTEISLVPSYQISKRVTNQKLNIKVHAVYDLINPNVNVQIHAYQNQRGDNIQ